MAPIAAVGKDCAATRPLAAANDPAAPLPLREALRVIEIGAVQRAGFHSVTPRMVVGDLEGAVSFLRTVFGAVGEVHADRPAEIRIGDSLVMITKACERELFPAFLYVYVDDVDAAYQRAVAAGAVSLEEPTETRYGDRRAMVRDPFDNVFQIARCGRD